jgi:hypothetical protein
MNAQFRRSLLIRQLRASLINKGLTEDEADAVIRRLHIEATQRPLDNREEILRSLAREIQNDKNLGTHDRKEKVRRVLETLFLGATASGLFELAKAAFGHLAKSFDAPDYEDAASLRRGEEQIRKSLAANERDFGPRMST